MKEPVSDMMLTRGNLPFNNTQSEIWNSTLEQLKEIYDAEIYNDWFKNLSFSGLKDSVLTISAPTKFIRDWVNNNYLSAIRTLVSNVDATIKRVDIQTSEKPKEAENKFSEEGNIVFLDGFNSNIDKKFTFDNFITGESNKLALQAAKCVLNDSMIGNPLFIQGSVGMGKTHLLQALASNGIAHYKNEQVCYLTAEKFMHQYWVSVRNNTVIEFRERIRNNKLLILDDIQFIIAKESTKQEFCNTLNYFIESKKQLILSGNVLLQNLEIDERNKSRLSSGFIADIGIPDLKLRKVILRSKANTFEVEVDEEVINYIAENVTSNIRELEASLSKIIYHARLVGTEINLKNAKTILHSTLASAVREINMATIIKETTKHFKLRKDDITSKKRVANIVLARQICMLLAKKYTDLSLQEIGANLGGRDHSTVIYSVSQLEKKIENDKSIQSEIDTITASF